MVTKRDAAVEMCELVEEVSERRRAMEKETKEKKEEESRRSQRELRKKVRAFAEKYFLPTIRERALNGETGMEFTWKGMDIRRMFSCDGSFDEIQIIAMVCSYWLRKNGFWVENTTKSGEVHINVAWNRDWIEGREKRKRRKT